MVIGLLLQKPNHPNQQKAKAMQPTKRYNVFNLIHKALRGMMYDAAASIQQTNFAKDEAVETLNKLHLLLELFDEHADHEDAHILVNVQRHDAKLVEAFEQDHVVDHHLTEALSAHIESWRNAAEPEGRLAAGLRIFYAFNDFIAFNLYHMNREENELLAVLWKNFTDAEILGMEHQIVQAIKPETMQIESTWMMRMANVPELAGWLGGVRAGAPEEVFGGLMHLAQMELSEERFETLATMLDGTPAMA